MNFLLVLAALIGVSEAGPARARLDLAIARFCAEEARELSAESDAAQICAEFQLVQMTTDPSDCGTREVCGACVSGRMVCQMVSACTRQAIGPAMDRSCSASPPLIRDLGPDDRPRFLPNRPDFPGRGFGGPPPGQFFR